MAHGPYRNRIVKTYKLLPIVDASSDAGVTFEKFERKCLADEDRADITFF